MPRSDLDINNTLDNLLNRDDLGRPLMAKDDILSYLKEEMSNRKLSALNGIFDTFSTRELGRASELLSERVRKEEAKLERIRGKDTPTPKSSLKHTQIKESNAAEPIKTTPSKKSRSKAAKKSVPRKKSSKAQPR